MRKLKKATNTSLLRQSEILSALKISFSSQISNKKMSIGGCTISCLKVNISFSKTKHFDS